MKKLIIPALLWSSLTMAGPVNPMENYTPTNHAENEISRFWRSLRTDLKNKDCYRRAHLWSYSLDRNYGVKSSKIFIHYTDKFNRELDNLGREGGLSFFKKKFWDADGVSRRTRSMVRSNITWDYHVAPLIKVGDKEMVLDRTLPLPYDAVYPYTENQAWNLKTRPATAEEWVEALTVRGEILWKARKAELEEEMAEKMEKAREARSDSRRRKYAQEYHAAQRAYLALEMDKMDSIDIKCQRVESIVEVDKNHDTAWCFYSVAPMYYYNEIDLRYLGYGETGYRYSMAPPMSIHTEENYENGRDYVQYSWNEKELEDAQKEIKIEHN